MQCEALFFKQIFLGSEAGITERTAELAKTNKKEAIITKEIIKDLLMVHVLKSNPIKVPCFLIIGCHKPLF